MASTGRTTRGIRVRLRFEGPPEAAWRTLNMVTDINEIIAEIQRLENQLEARWDVLREQFQYTLEGHRVRFANGMRRLHRRYRTGILPYLRETPPGKITGIQADYQ